MILGDHRGLNRGAGKEGVTSPVLRQGSLCQACAELRALHGARGSRDVDEEISGAVRAASSLKRALWTLLMLEMGTRVGVR
ncbi:hypothetical protein NDU88_003460 [Pleurodeles waltl]|uniref:Uncharacterized protein n=1 Tax=Pleurodeles waltl TaxID=8319 RepID=A0AAV7MDW3_PLEWA|nr:hypothetical protein NDU88_003460 [Pleurodeles waltl]